MGSLNPVASEPARARLPLRLLYPTCPTHHHSSLSGLCSDPLTLSSPGSLLDSYSSLRTVPSPQGNEGRALCGVSRSACKVVGSRG